MFQLISQLNSYLATLKQEEGQDLVEYALIIALVSIALTGALTGLTGGISGVFTAIVTAFG